MVNQDVLDNIIDMWKSYHDDSNNHIELCFVCPKVYPLFNPQAKGVIGGAETDMYYLSTELAKDKEFGVHIICGDYGQASWEVREKVWLWNWGSRNPLILWRILKWINADVYITKTMSWGVPLVYAFCRRHHKKFAYRAAHDWEVDGTFQKRYPILHWFFRYSIKHADLVIAQTEHEASFLRTWLKEI